MSTTSRDPFTVSGHGGTQSIDRVPTLGHSQQPRKYAESANRLEAVSPCPTVSRADRVTVSPYGRGDTVDTLDRVQS